MDVTEGLVATTSVLDELCAEILNAGALELRDVPERVTNDEVDTLPLGQQPFLYASGNWGPGYVSIKGLVAVPGLIDKLSLWLTMKMSVDLVRTGRALQFIAGNVTGGVPPGIYVQQYYSKVMGRILPFVYVRDTRKKGGQKELVTGATHLISSKMRGVVIEELTNFCETTCNSVAVLREMGFQVDDAACILFYENPVAIERLEAEEITMHYLIGLPYLLSVALRHKTHPQELVEAYCQFLQDPPGWQAARGLTKVERGGTR